MGLTMNGLLDSRPNNITLLVRFNPTQPDPPRLPPPPMTLAGASRRRRAPRSHPPLPLLAVVLLLALTPPPRAYALVVPLREVAALLSLSHSLLTRVAIARADRGDDAAAARARRIASHLSLLSSRGAWALGWDYLRHYAFSSAAGCGLSCATAAARLLAAAAEASRIQSTADAAQWLRRNYGDLQAAAAQLLSGLLGSFSEQGPLREVVLDVKWEVEEGELLKDCLQVGAKDLEGLLVIAKDLIFGASRASSRHSEL